MFIYYVGVYVCGTHGRIMGLILQEHDYDVEAHCGKLDDMLERKCINGDCVEAHPMVHSINAKM